MKRTRDTGGAVMSLSLPPKSIAERRLAAFDYDLPDSRIARFPAEQRDTARLLGVIASGLGNHRITDLPQLLQPGDLLVANDTRVVPARCHLSRKTGARIELLFLRRTEGFTEAMVRKSRKLKAGETLTGPGDVAVKLVERVGEGRWQIEATPSPEMIMEAIGEMPLPPYLGRPEDPTDRERYQTTFARVAGAVAAPTAGLHVTDSLRARLAERGVGWATVTLHVGAGTFRPLRASDLEAGELHSEWYEIPPETRDAIERTRSRGGRVIAIGTTSTRALESATAPGARVPTAGSGVTRLFIEEGYTFRCVDGLLTNFHLPRSSLLFLVSAFIGREALFAAYRHALQHQYRFYSYGDAMLIL